MVAAVMRADVVREVLVLADFTALVSDPRAGAVVVFQGAVRADDHGKEVAAIDYVGHPDANRILGEIAASRCGSAGVYRIALSHRIGHLEVGEVAAVVAVSAKHRGEAFQCASDLIDEMKAVLPTWKKQFFPDGTHEWPGLVAHDED